MNNTDNKKLIIAHRGASKLAPGNTLEAFQKAIDLNADYIEFDRLISKDGEVVIEHGHAFFLLWYLQMKRKKCLFLNIKKLIIMLQKQLEL